MSEEENKRERFGRYLILDHLVDGGMAKICRARFLGEQADKIVAIKMVQPKYSQDESFKQMFMDEIKMTFGLIHPNIVQTYDYGMQNNQLFVAMEYCDGRNLKEYLDKLKERKFVFPVEISTYIITQACQALHYAHTYTDKLTGKSANIIHRDISPHNIMLTYDGAIKVIDFGIAKSDNNSEATQAGTIKGKLSYLAPEYLEGEKLDARYDQFAVGITLWEMLCSRKLFKANNDLAVLKKIQECKIPAPSSINPNVPKELDQIVMKSLAKDRNQRYQDMDKMNRALMKFLYTHYPDFNATDLAYFAKELFKEEIKKDREKLFEFGKIDLKPYLEDMRKEQEGGVSSNSSTSSEPSGDEESPKAKKENVFDFGFEEEEDASPRKKVAKQAKSTQQESVDVEKKYGHLKEGEEEGVQFELDSGKAEPSTTSTNKKSATRTSVKKKQEGTRTRATGGKKKKKAKGTRASVSTTSSSKKGKNKAKSSSKKNGLIKVAAVAGVILFVGYQFLTKNFLSDDSAPKQEVASSASQGGKVGDRQPSSEANSEISGAKAQLQITNFDKYKQKLYVNGQQKSMGVLGDVDIPAGEEIVIRVQTPGRRHYITEVNVPKGETHRMKIPEMPRADYGYVVTSRPCVSGQLIFDLFGESRNEELPIPQGGGIAFPVKYGENGRAVASEYEVYYQKEGEDIKRRVDITIDSEDQVVDLCEKL